MKTTPHDPIRAGFVFDQKEGKLKMKNTMFRKLLACLLSLALLLPFGALCFAENGPYPTKTEEDWPYARLELIELDADEQPDMVSDGEWEIEKTLPLFAENTVTAQASAVYDLAANTLTLTDFNQGNYALRVNLMGDDFTLCVKGDCRLTEIEVYGGGVIQPKWGCGLKITGDGTLTVNPNKTYESGIFFAPQEEDQTVFTVDPSVKLNVYGSETAVEVYGAAGEFKMQSGGAQIPLKKEAAVRRLNVFLEGYSNEMEWNINRCLNAADPEGLYGMSEWYDMDDNPVYVTVERYVYLEKFNVYVEEYVWQRENGEDAGLRFDTLQDANDAGFTYVLDEEGNQTWMTLNTFANYGTELLYADADGNRYAMGYDYDDEGGEHEIALSAAPIEELPGLYVFLPAPGVDPEALTELQEDRVMEDQFDYAFPDAEFIFHIDGDILLGDVNDDGQVTAEDARYALRAAVGLDDAAEGLDFSDPANRCYVAANVDGEAGISAADARLILRAAVGLENLG